MSKKYSASKFRFSLACNSPWPTELPPEKGLGLWGLHSEYSGLRRYSSHRGFLKEKTEADGLCITGWPPLLPLLFAASCTTMGLPSPRALGIFVEGYTCFGPQVLTPQSRTSRSINSLPPNFLLQVGGLLTLVNSICGQVTRRHTASSLALSDEPEALPWNVLDNPTCTVTRSQTGDPCHLSHHPS